MEEKQWSAGERLQEHGKKGGGGQQACVKCFILAGFFSESGACCHYPPYCISACTLTHLYNLILFMWIHVCCCTYTLHGWHHHKLCKKGKCFLHFLKQQLQMKDWIFFHSWQQNSFTAKRWGWGSWNLIVAKLLLAYSEEKRLFSFPDLGSQYGA